jgi:hypothetical protein
MTRAPILPFLGMLVLTSCDTPRPSVPERRFVEEDNAGIVIRYYSDKVSRVLKPAQMEGPFLSTFDRQGVLELAKQQPGRELAVVILLQFNASEEVKRDWMSLLEGVGYRRVVFLLAEKGNLKINGLQILENPGASPVEQGKQPKPNS